MVSLLQLLFKFALILVVQEFQVNQSSLVNCLENVLRKEVG